MNAVGWAYTVQLTSLMERAVFNTKTVVVAVAVVVVVVVVVVVTFVHIDVVCHVTAFMLCHAAALRVNTVNDDLFSCRGHVKVSLATAAFRVFS